MALSANAFAVQFSTVTATLAKLGTNLAGFRTDVATLLHTKFPTVTVAQAVADLTAGNVVVLIDQAAGWVGVGRGLSDAKAAIKVKTG